MKILKHGDASLNEVKLNTEDFECSLCGCNFTADFDEYYVEKGSSFEPNQTLIYHYSVTVTDIYACSCPECHKMVIKEKTRIVNNPCTVTFKDL